MAQQVKWLATKSGDWSSIPRTHTGRENINHSCRLFSDLHMWTMKLEHVCTAKNSF